MTQTVAITGNTYPVKDALKALGARWNGDKKAWMVSADKADAARKLVSGGGNVSTRRSVPKCHSCGETQTVYNMIWADGACRQCHQDGF